MDTGKFINLTICTVIAVVILTTVAVPVMTLHESKQDTYDNTGYMVRGANASPVTSLSLTGGTTDINKVTLNGVDYNIPDMIQEGSDYVPLFICDAGYITAKPISNYIQYDLYLYSANIENQGQFVQDHLIRFGFVHSTPSSQFELDLNIENGLMTADISDDPGGVSLHVETPVSLFTYVYDPNGDYVIRTLSLNERVVWKDEICWVSTMPYGASYCNGDTVIWNPDAENASATMVYTDLGGGAKRLTGGLSVSFSADGQDYSASEIPSYFVVPAEVVGAVEQGVDNPAIIAAVAIIPLIIAISVLIYIGRNIFSKE